MLKSSYTLLQKALAWSVHIFTSSGLVAGFMAILAIQEHDWRTAMFWLIVALVIDGIDGSFARIFKVKEVLPFMDGKTIDYVIDFANYAIIPAYMFYEAGLVPEVWKLPLTVLILLVSALYYGKEGMVSEDNYFMGFPVMWNMVMYYYLFVTAYTSTAYIILTLIFAILHFVPIKLVYPSQNDRFKLPTIINTVLFIGTLAMLVFYYPERPMWLVVSAYGTALYYALMAVYNTWIEPKTGLRSEG
ncbi:MAG: phosphatidylcholine synthase [Saprospiraceae bacterium]|jgi:phosphatidylcholine synthase